MESLKRARRPVRREFDNLHRDLDALLKADPLKVEEIKVKFKLFIQTFDSLLYHDNCIMEQLVKDQATEEEENLEFDEIRDFKIRAETVRELKEKLVPLSTSAESVTAGSNNPETKMRTFKLPSVQVKKFSGQLKDWLAFWAQFQKIDEDSLMHGSDKFWYLLQYLEPGTDAYEIASGYPQSNENYPKVIEDLKKRYGNEDIQLQVYIRELLNLVISNANSKDKIPVKTLFLKLSSHLRALKSLKLEKADPATWLFPLVESSLPENILYNWQRSPLSSHDGSVDVPPRTRLDILMSFMEKEVEIRQRIDITRSFTQGHANEPKGKQFFGKEKRNDKRPIMPTLSTFHVGDVNKCIFCEKPHESSSCYRARDKLDYSEKMKILRSKGRCFRCCGKHLSKDCDAVNLKCDICERKHLTVLCGMKQNSTKILDAPPQKRSRTDKGIGTTSTVANLECMGDVALQTLLVKIVNGNTEKVVRAFIDSGSQRSYILKSVAKELKLEPVDVERVKHSMFGGQETPMVTHNKYEIKLKSTESDFHQIVEVRDHIRICGRIPRTCEKNPDLIRELKESNITLTDTFTCLEIGLLIGADIYPRILTGNIVNLRTGAVAIQTRFGWTLLGQLANYENLDSMMNLCLSMSVLDSSISKLWELEVIGIQDPNENVLSSRSQYEARMTFLKNISRMENGRYCVKLPWKENRNFLPSNKEVAVKRLESATRNLIRTRMFDMYSHIFREWEKEGFIERVPDEVTMTQVHYVPHRPVVKVDSLTTPVRPVFDGSSKTSKSLSLNDCLFTGDNYVQLIPELLLRFCEKSVAFVADIRKAFQMIGIDEEDRDVMRFLWWKDENMDVMIEYRHTRVMFGATCSPFILGVVLYHHLTNLSEKDGEIGRKLLSTLYVDNCVSSEDTQAEYESFRMKSTELLRDAKMDLRLWLSNVDEFDDESNHIISVLGVQWNRRTDQLYISSKKIDVPEKVTKRVILSAVHKLFDPLGFICPAVLPMKVLLQRTWLSKWKWDEELPERETKKFMAWCKDLSKIQEIKIPRLVTRGVSDRSTWSVHTFTDASKEAYSVAVFLRTKVNDTVHVQLLMAKSRVAPLKVLTIPKLELMGCLMGARLTATVKTALNMVNVREYYWTDSSTALAWIRRNDQWGTFVANRTNEIRKVTESENWRHVPGTRNPADLPSRGCSPAELLRSRWWEGPSFLYEEEPSWPSSEEVSNEKEIRAELRKSGTPVKVLSSSFLDKLNTSKEFSYLARVRIIGWVRRFLHNQYVKDPENRKMGPLSIEELRRAEIVFLREIQRETFPEDDKVKFKGLEVIQDEWGLLRVKTRLTYRSDPRDFKYPILLPHKRKEVRQLVQDVHRNYVHAGVGFLLTKLRKRFWIVKSRQTIRNVISKCVRCRRLAAKNVSPEAAPLPLDRIKDAEVFEVLGIDLAGPLVLKTGGKVWMVIFTCAVFRAVHFEVVKSLSTVAFIRVLAKFVQKFRRPDIIYTDNGTNFRGADNLFKKLDWKSIKDEYQTNQINWKFNPATSSWWGGWFERLIRTAKELIRRTVGKGSLNLKELESILATVTEVMNNRPLTYVSEDPNDLEPLTPALFLNPFGGVSFPEGEITEAQKMRFRLKYVRTLRQELKNRFLREYLALLVNRNPKRITRALTVGELVFVGSDDRKRIEWPLGKVLENIPGPDGVCRLAKVKVANGVILRSVQRLYPLEMEITTSSKPGERESVVTRAGRHVKIPVRFRK